MGLEDWPVAHSSQGQRGAAAGLGPAGARAQVEALRTPPARRPTRPSPARSTRPRRSASRSPRSRAGWSARSAGCWPRSAGLGPVQAQGRTCSTPTAPSTSTQLPPRRQDPGRPGALPGGLPKRAPRRLPVGLVRPPGPPGCRAILRLFEIGASGEAADVEVQCDSAGRGGRMVEAFGQDGRANLPRCKRRRPASAGLRPERTAASMHMSTILQGASNSWFSGPAVGPVDPRRRATSSPSSSTRSGPTSRPSRAGRTSSCCAGVGMLREFADYGDDQVWAAIEREARRGGLPAGRPTHPT